MNESKWMLAENLQPGDKLIVKGSRVTVESLTIDCRDKTVTVRFEKSASDLISMKLQMNSSVWQTVN